MKCQMPVTNQEGKSISCGNPAVWDVHMEFRGARDVVEEYFVCSACLVRLAAENVVGDLTLQDFQAHRNQD